MQRNTQWKKISDNSIFFPNLKKSMHIFSPQKGWGYFKKKPTKFTASWQFLLFVRHLVEEHPLHCFCNIISWNSVPPHCKSRLAPKYRKSACYCWSTLPLFCSMKTRECVRCDIFSVCIVILCVTCQNLLTCLAKDVSMCCIDVTKLLPLELNWYHFQYMFSWKLLDIVFQVWILVINEIHLCG